MLKQQLPWKLLILFLLLILSFFLLTSRVPVHIVVLTLTLQSLFIISLRFYSIPFLILYFVISAIVIIAQPFITPEMRVFKLISFLFYFFVGYLGYYSLKSIEDEFYVNKSFVLEEKQNLSYIKQELLKTTEKKLTLEEQMKQLQFLSNMLNKAWTFTTWGELVEFCTQQTQRLFPDAIVIYTQKNKENGNIPRNVCFAGLKDLNPETKIDNLDNFIFDQSTPILIENVHTDLKFKIIRQPSAPFDYKSIMAAPIPIDPKKTAALKVYGLKSPFTIGQLRLLQYISEMLSMLLLNITLYEKTEKLAKTDGITGLYVQHYFNEKIQEEIYRSRKHGSIFSLIIMDIDNFKQFNDIYGHQAGDFILSKTSDFIKAFIRSIDFPCRYGGDEFFIILPETDSIGARSLSERIRVKICEETTNMKFAETNIDRRITVSIGCGQYHPSIGDHKAFISKIDGLLYEAKRKGKNMVIGDTDGS